MCGFHDTTKKDMNGIVQGNMGLYNRLGIASRLDKAPIGGLEVAPIVPLLLKPSDRLSPSVSIVCLPLKSINVEQDHLIC